MLTLLLLQVAGVGVDGLVGRPFATPPHRVGGAQPLPSLVHPEPHRVPAV